MSDGGRGLRDVLTRIEKPARYVGGEWHEIRKNPRAASFKVALAFPDVYEIGMSYLGQKILYGLLNAEKDILAERVFAPWPDFEAELRRSGRRLGSLENGLPLCEFDIVGFSLLYELNDSNVLTMLDLGGVPLFAAERKASDPLVIAGGPAAFNPEPVAEFFDLFVLGDGEEAFPEIIAAVREMKRKRAGRPELLEALSGIPGVYVPSLYAVVRGEGSPLLAPVPKGNAPPVIRKRVLRDFGTSFFPERIVVPSLRVVFDRVAMEAARGCPQNCRFCQASSLYFPHRTKDPDFIVKTMIRSLRRTGYEDASLSALSISDYPGLEETVRCLMGELGPEKISLSLSSLRPHGLSRDLVEDILKVRKTGFTLVPEAGTERLRAVINKKVRDEDIREGLTYAFEAGWKLVKFYFMAGLPTETEEDLRGIAELVRGSLELGRSLLGSRPRINVSLSSFIPKPHTPFQWLAMAGADVLAEKQAFVRRELGRSRSVEFKDHPVETSILEAVFSRGDRRLNRVLFRAWSNGARFDSWGDRMNFPLWEEAMAAEGVDPAEYLGDIDRAAVLPWDHIDAGLKKAHLLRELDHALRAEFSPSCLERTCRDCDGCDLRFWKKPAAPARIPVVSVAPPRLGQPAGEIVRYRAVYGKRGKARFLSHIDLIHVLQRSFRRAGVPVRKTEGFHPKMDFSYGPALPLGMEGWREVVEFKSPNVLEEKTFLGRINRSLPPGLRFRRLERLAPGSTSLSGAITGLVYSMDFDSEDFSGARRREGAGAGESGGTRPTASVLKKRLEEYVARTPGAASFQAAFKGRRLVLRLPASPPKGLRVQDIIRDAFGVENAVFHLRRDEVVLEPRKPAYS